MGCSELERTQNPLVQLSRCVRSWDPDRPKATQPGRLSLQAHCPALNCVCCSPCLSPSGTITSRLPPSLSEQDFAQSTVGGWFRADEAADSSCGGTKSCFRRHRGVRKTENVQKKGGALGAANEARKLLSRCREYRTAPIRPAKKNKQPRNQWENISLFK